MDEILIGLRHSNGLIQRRLLSEIFEAVKNGGEEVITTLLERISSSDDTEVCSKLMFILTIIIKDIPHHREQVASCAEVYDAGARVLRAGAGRARAALGLLTVLQGGGGVGGGGGGGAAYAQARVRLSGCLHVMGQLFLKDVMYAEMWQSLCICLAASSLACEPSQTLCSHLVPVCVQKTGGGGGGGGGLQVLRALLEGHAANTQLFLQCGGMRVFTRGVLVRGEGCWLLQSVLSGAPAAAALAFAAAVPRTLADLISTHGADSQVGQWCSVCLFHITKGLKETSQTNKGTDSEELNFSRVSEILNESSDGDNVPAKSPHDSHFKYFNDNRVDKLANKIDSFLKTDMSMLSRTNNFSHIENYNLYGNMETKFDKIPLSSLRNRSQSANRSISTSSQTPQHFMSYKTNETHYQTQVTKICQTSFDDTKLSATKSIQVSVDTVLPNEFCPQTCSTPTTNGKPNAHRVSRTCNTRKPNHPRVEKPKRSNTASFMSSSRILNKVEAKLVHQPSIGSSIIKSLNASCNSILSGFRKLIPGREQSQDTSFVNQNRNVARNETSFAEFMSMRGYGPSKSVRSELNFSQVSKSSDSRHSTPAGAAEEDSCRACNDTLMLRRKLQENRYLQDTVKKLREGVSIYGCNFKQIARVYWPQEKYMTSAVLYDLYRKLIVKKTY